ncbi:MAG: biotin/lipoyl-binding protein [Desulfobacterales bacterium]|nr:biotin/lipoyl-binding protein [Desulfobacterales bacterium]
MINRIFPNTSPSNGLRILLDAKGYFITNTARDLSQSDFKNRILPHTDFAVADERDEAGFFSLEITGGASIHVDLLRKQINPFERLALLRKKMPRTMFQTLCRGINLFGYRPYPENVIRLTVKEFVKYVEVWRVFDFLNYVPNMIPVFEEVKKAGKYLEPAICFSTGPEHTDEYYVKKVHEIIDVTGKDIILAIKNHSGIGTPGRIFHLISAIKNVFPDLIIHYHGHNTDGNDVGRILASVKAGAKIVDAADHSMTGFFGPPAILTVIQVLEEEGYHAEGINKDAIIETSNKLKKIRPAYSQFESQFKGFDPTVHIHKLPGGAMGSSFEQAVKGNFLDKMPDILMKELPKVHIELGNFWSVTPGSQILWTTAVAHTLSGKRYENASQDLKNLMLEKYGPFPFRKPSDEIYEMVFGSNWKNILKNEAGCETCIPIDIDMERKKFEQAIGRPCDLEELVLYLQHPKDTIDFFKYEEEYGKTYILPPEIWFKKGGFAAGDIIKFEDYKGKHHQIIIGASNVREDSILTYMMIDHHPEPFVYRKEEKKEKVEKKIEFNLKEIDDLAEMGEIRAKINGVVIEIHAKENDIVNKGDLLLTIEAMKMLSNINSPINGIVKEIAVKLGNNIKQGDLLIRLKIKA